MSSTPSALVVEGDDGKNSPTAAAAAASASFPLLAALPGAAPVFDDATGKLRWLPALVNYADESSDGVVHLRRLASGDDAAIDGVVWNRAAVDVRNGRTSEERPTLHRNGFELVRCPLVPKRSDGGGVDVDFFDSDSVIDKYYPRCEKLLEQVLCGGVEVKAFDHNVRLSPNHKKSGTELKNGGGSKAQQPLGVVHGDYTRVSGPRRVQDLAGPPKANDVLRSRLGDGSLLNPELAKEALEGKRRFALINVWRSIDPDSPVEARPLACCDAQTVSAGELRTLQLHYDDRIGENYLALASEKHRWYFFPQMTIDEALLIKQWDSDGALAKGEDRDDAELSTFSIHSAFLGPDEENKRPRQSIEVRCVCIW